MSEGKDSSLSPLSSTVDFPAMNPGVEWNGSWVARLSVDEKALVREAREFETLPLPRGRPRRKALLRVLSSVDLTTLSGDDTRGRVRELCKRARRPVGRKLQKQLGPEARDARVAAVCVFPAFLPTALTALEGSGVKVATVAAGFPHGLNGLPERVREVEAVAREGAQEIDVVIRREWALAGKWDRLYDELSRFRAAAGEAHLKVILATGELGELNRVARAGLTALMAGADFIKTSTGKEKVNATLPVGMAMIGALRAYRRRYGHMGGLKPAGGIRTAGEGLRWLALVEEKLGTDAGAPARFRIGASSLLDSLLEALGPGLPYR